MKSVTTKEEIKIVSKNNGRASWDGSTSSFYQDFWYGGRFFYWYHCFLEFSFKLLYCLGFLEFCLYFYYKNIHIINNLIYLKYQKIKSGIWFPDLIYPGTRFYWAGTQGVKKGIRLTGYPAFQVSKMLNIR